MVFISIRLWKPCSQADQKFYDALDIWRPSKRRFTPLFVPLTPMSTRVTHQISKIWRDFNNTLELTAFDLVQLSKSWRHILATWNFQNPTWNFLKHSTPPFFPRHQPSIPLVSSAPFSLSKTSLIFLLSSSFCFWLQPFEKLQKIKKKRSKNSFYLNL